MTPAEAEWAGLARYREDNARLGQPHPGERRVVFLGDSLTEGWPVASDYFARHGYIGRGIGGQTTSQMLMRFNADVLALGPRVLVLLAGTNDIAGNAGPYDPVLTRRNLATMTAQAQAKDIHVILASVLPAFDFPWRPGLQPAAKILELNSWLRDFARGSQCHYVDYYAALADSRPGLPAHFGEDGVHPNAAGYAVMERLADTALGKVFAQLEAT